MAMQSVSDPNLVKVVSDEELADAPFVDGADCLVLYRPRTSKEAVLEDDEEPKDFYELVVRGNDGANFSLHRVSCLADGKKAIKRLYMLPLLLRLDESVFSDKCLQDICDALRRNESLTAAHLAAQLNLTRALESPLVLQYINAVDEKGQTPLMMAVIKSNLSPIKLLLENGAEERIA